VAVGIETEEVAEGLDSDYGAGNGIVFVNRILEKNLQGFPCRAAEIGKKCPIVEEVTVEDFRDAEYKMPVGGFLDDIHAQPFPKLNHALLME